MLEALEVALGALRDAAAPPTLTAASRALGAALAALLRLLEAPGTPLGALGPALRALRLAAELDVHLRQLRSLASADAVPGAPPFCDASSASTPAPASAPHQHQQSEVALVFTDLIDLLLGWSLDPALASEDRQARALCLVALQSHWCFRRQAHDDVCRMRRAAIHALFLAWAEHWPAHADFTSGLIATLTEDLHAAALAYAAHSADAAPPPASAPAAATARQEQHRQQQEELDACLRLAGAATAILRGAGAGGAAALALPPLPALLASLDVLVSGVGARRRRCRRALAELTARPPGPAAPARRAHAAARAEAEAELAAALEQHRALCALCLPALRQLSTAARDLLLDGGEPSPMPEGLAALLALQRRGPLLPPVAAEPTDTTLPEVKQLVRLIFARVAGEDGGAAPVGAAVAPMAPAGRQLAAWLVEGMVELLLRLLDGAADPQQQPSPPAAAAAGASGAEAGALGTAALLLCVLQGISGAACLRVAQDARLLGPLEPAAGSGGGGGVWAFASAGNGDGDDDAAPAALRSFLCDVLGMHGSVSRRLFQLLLSRAATGQLGGAAAAPASQEAADGGVGALFALRALGAACAAQALAQQQLVALRSAVEGRLLGAAAGDDDDDGDLAAASQLEQALFATWSACWHALCSSFVGGSGSSSGAGGGSDEDGASGAAGGSGGEGGGKAAALAALARHVAEGLEVVAELMLASQRRWPQPTRRPAHSVGGGMGAGGDEDPAAAWASRLCAWPAQALAQLPLRVGPAAAGAALRRPGAADALLRVLRVLSSATWGEARAGAVHAATAAAHVLSPSAHNDLAPAPPTPALAAPPKEEDADEEEEEEEDVVELLSRLAALALELLPDVDARVSQLAASLALDLAAVPLLALTTTFRAPSCDPRSSAAAVDATAPSAAAATNDDDDALGELGGDGGGLLLRPPSWHDALAAAAQPPRCNWRPASLGRLFGLLFPEGALAARQLPAEVPGPGGVLLRRRAEPPGGVGGAAAADNAALRPGVIALQLAALEVDVTGVAEAPLPSPWVEFAAELSPAELPPASKAGAPPAPRDDAPDGPPARRGDDDAAAAAAALPWQRSSAAAAAWQACQDAASSTVAARLRTHLGGPTQSLAALERLLQLLLSQLSSTAAGGVPAGGGGAGAAEGAGDGAARREGAGPVAAAAAAAALHEAGWLALEFVDALERGVAAAVHGGLAGGGLPPAVLAFYSANRKVRGAVRGSWRGAERANKHR